MTSSPPSPIPTATPSKSSPKPPSPRPSGLALFITILFTDYFYRFWRQEQPATWRIIRVFILLNFKFLSPLAALSNFRKFEAVRLRMIQCRTSIKNAFSENYIFFWKNRGTLHIHIFRNLPIRISAIEGGYFFGKQKNFCYLCGRKDSTQMIVTDIRYYYYCRYGRFYGHNDAGYRV